MCNKIAPRSHRHEHLKSHTPQRTLHHICNAIALPSTAKSSNSPPFQILANIYFFVFFLSILDFITPVILDEYYKL